MSIRYVITGQNPSAAAFVIFDSKHPCDGITKSSHKAEIRDRMFTGNYSFTLDRRHAHYDDIDLRQTIITIYDIDADNEQTEDQKIVFRGDVTDIKTVQTGRRTYRCQPDIQWLADVPDVFSAPNDSTTVYYIGVDDGYVRLWFDTRHAYGAQDGNKAIYGSYDRNSTISLRNMWADYGFRPKMACSLFDIEFPTGSTALKVGLRKFTITRDNNTNYPISVMYFGNIGLLYNQADITGSTFNVIETDLAERHIVSDDDIVNRIPLGMLNIPTLADIREDEHQMEGETVADLSALDWCIVHYYDPLMSDVTAGEFMGRGRNYTKLYTTQTPTLDRLPVQVSRTQHTTVKNMVSSCFNPVSGALRGYNTMCDPDRRIYRGDIEVNGELDHSGVDTIYSNLSAWTEVTGGYVRIRHENGYAYVDLISNSGVYEYGFSVDFGKNLADYAKNEDVNGLYTAIYPKGIYGSDPGRTPVTLKNADMSGVSQLDHYNVNTANGLLYNSEATGLYGNIVMYQDYDLDRVPAGTEIQYLYDKASADLQNIMEAFVTFDISAVDKRLLREDNATQPILGNYYAVTTPFGRTWAQLTAIATDHIKPSASKLTFGDRKNILSDYTAKGAKK